MPSSIDCIWFLLWKFSPLVSLKGKIMQLCASLQRKVLEDITQCAVFFFFSPSAPSQLTLGTSNGCLLTCNCCPLTPFVSRLMSFTFSFVWKRNLCKMCLAMLTGRIPVKSKQGGAQLLSLCTAPGWACPYCYFWTCWFSIAMECSIYKIWVAAYVRWKSKRVRVCPGMCIYSSLASAGATYIWGPIQPV